MFTLIILTCSINRRIFILFQRKTGPQGILWCHDYLSGSSDDLGNHQHELFLNLSCVSIRFYQFGTMLQFPDACPGRRWRYRIIIQVWGPEATHCLTVMDDRYKYIYWFYEDSEKNLFPTEELFDLHKDPYELKNVANDHEYQSQLTRMRKIYDQQLQHWKTEGEKYNGYEKYGVLFDRDIPFSAKKEFLTY